MARARPGLPRLLPLAGEALLVGVVYYVAAHFSLELALIQKNVTPLWPPTGIAVAAFLLLRRSVWPGVAVAALLVNLPISADPLAALVTAAGNTIAPLFAATLLQRVDFHPQIDRVRDAAAIVFLAALLSMTISATIGSVTLVVSGAIPEREFLAAWTVWWTGDAMGVLVVAPFLLGLRNLRWWGNGTWARRAEAVGLFTVIAAASLLATTSELKLLFLVIPLVGWVAWRFQQRGAPPAALLVVSLASWAAAHDQGPFQTGSLFSRMLTLQAFNATVAFTSLFFAALVTERIRSREALERAAGELEDRVRQRTRQLAEAQHLAHVGSWEWVIPENRVSWSDEMYLIHGYRPQEFPVTFEKATELVVEEDLARIRLNVGTALGAGQDQSLPPNEYRIIRPDGDERVLMGKARLEVDTAGHPFRMLGTVQDVTESKQAEREHRIAETLQRSLLPERLPDIPGVELAARYVPASADMEVGGDWYDVIQLPNGQVGLVIGDVAGHGLRAASTMGQLRMALRAYTLEDPEPAAVLARAHRLVQRLGMAEMATLVHVLFDPESGSIRYTNAGHPPPLVIAGDGSCSFLEEELAPPLGAVPHADGYTEANAQLPPDATLLLFTDGLVERRGESLLDGLERLRQAAGGVWEDLEALCERVVSSLVGHDVSDDVALLAMRPQALAGRPLRIRAPSEPHALAPLRHALRRWLKESGVDDAAAYQVLVACGEACANATQHAYGAGAGGMEVELDLVDHEIHLSVLDSGSWRASSPSGGGRGLDLMRGLMDSVEVESGEGGTVVRMRLRLGRGGDKPRPTEGPVDRPVKP